MTDNNQTTLFDQRIVYLDYLRVAAVFAVIVLHTAVQNWHTAGVDSVEWGVFNISDSAVRWCVPVFVMISGVLFVGRNIPIHTIYSKYILRLFLSFILWSAFYSLFFDGDAHEKTLHFLKGHYHLWYIWLITGLYICLPFINAVVSNIKLTQYYLLLALLFASVIPTMMYLAADFGSEALAETAKAVNKTINNMHLYFVMGYPGFFILGSAINKTAIKKAHRAVIYTAGLFGFAAICILTKTVSIHSGSQCDNYYDFLSLNVLLESVAVFTWFKHRKYNVEWLNEIFRKLSRCCFGVYLVHPFILNGLDRLFGINTFCFNPVISVILISLFVTAVSFVISLLLNSIPFIKDYFV